MILPRSAVTVKKGVDALKLEMDYSYLYQRIHFTQRVIIDVPFQVSHCLHDCIIDPEAE